jgi:UDP:flavonoid glycosyltransferase YjiC (YdhE family)
MRILFSSVSAYGHILPLAPLMAAAIDGGHEVALLANEETRQLVTEELAAEVTLLAAGVPVMEFLEEAARRTGGDPLHPTPAMIGEIFGGTRLHLDAESTLRRAREWAPDLVVAEQFDSVGPLVAARLGLPWHQVGIGPGLPAMVTEQIALTTRPHYERVGVRPVPPATYIDRCPAALQDPGFVSPAETLPVRAQAHHRPADRVADVPRFGDPRKPTVLLTLGTVFSDASTLAAFGSAVAAADVNVMITLGVAIQDPPAISGPGEVRYVSFVPLDQLLADVDLVVAAGGSGTILGALSHGKPMVLCPQGTDQPINAARAAAAGVAVVVDTPAEVTGAVARVLADDVVRARAAEVAAEIEKTPTPAEVIATIIRMS